MKITYKAGLLAAAGVLALGSLGACSANSDNNANQSPSPSETSASASESHPIGAECTEDSIKAVVPEGATDITFKCGNLGDAQIAGIKYGPGNNVIFAKKTGVGGPWEIVNKDTICGAASAGLPADVLDFCD